MGATYRSALYFLSSVEMLWLPHIESALYFLKSMEMCLCETSERFFASLILSKEEKTDIREPPLLRLTHKVLGVKGLNMVRCEIRCYFALSHRREGALAG